MPDAASPDLHRIAKDLDDAVSVAMSRLRLLSAAAVSHRPAPDRWTIKQVIGHLIDSASNNHQRFVRAQFVDGELRFPKYEQNEWIRSQAYDEVEWDDLLALWQSYNRHLAHLIRRVKPESLDTRCVIGPYDPVTLRFLIEDYVVHLKHHLDKITERTAGNSERSGRPMS